MLLGAAKPEQPSKQRELPSAAAARRLAAPPCVRPVQAGGSSGHNRGPDELPSTKQRLERSGLSQVGLGSRLGETCLRSNRGKHGVHRVRGRLRNVNSLSPAPRSSSLSSPRSSSPSLAFTQSPSVSNNPKIPTYDLICAVILAVYCYCSLTFLSLKTPS